MSYDASDLADFVREALVERGVTFEVDESDDQDIGYFLGDTHVTADALAGPGNAVVSSALNEYLTRVDALVDAAKHVVRSWERGTLAGAVRELDTQLRQLTGETPTPVTSPLPNAPQCDGDASSWS